MSETRDEKPPTTRQLRLLEQIRERLVSRWAPTPLNVRAHYQHWEDEELGIAPPLGRSAWFNLQIDPLTLSIGTPLPWVESTGATLTASFGDYDRGQSGSAWAL